MHSKKAPTKLSKAPKAAAETVPEARRLVLAKMARMSPTELFGLAVRAGIYTDAGKLTDSYRAESDA